MGEKRDFLEELVYSALETDGGFRRFTQDSPIMPDVWIRWDSQLRKNIKLWDRKKGKI